MNTKIALSAMKRTGLVALAIMAILIACTADRDNTAGTGIKGLDWRKGEISNADPRLQSRIIHAATRRLGSHGIDYGAAVMRYWDAAAP